MMVRSLVFGVALVLSAVGLACGGNPERDKAEEVAIAFTEAIDNRDAVAACELSPKDGLGEFCEQFVLTGYVNSASFPEVTNSMIDGDKATIEVDATGPSGDVTFVYYLVKEEGGEWKAEGADGSGVGP